MKNKNKENFENSDFGLSFLDLAKFAALKNFKPIGLALNLKSLYNLKAPVIIFIKVRNNEHFTVFKHIDKNYVYLADPSFGNIKIKIDKFKEMFYQRHDLKYPGKILAIIPINKKQKKQINENFMKIKNNSNFIYESIKNNLYNQH